MCHVWFLETWKLGVAAESFRPESTWSTTDLNTDHHLHLKTTRATLPRLQRVITRSKFKTETMRTAIVDTLSTIHGSTPKEMANSKARVGGAAALKPANLIVSEICSDKRLQWWNEMRWRAVCAGRLSCVEAGEVRHTVGCLTLCWKLPQLSCGMGGTFCVIADGCTSGAGAS